MSNQDLLQYNPQAHQLNLKGSWTLKHVNAIQEQIKKITLPTQIKIKIDGSHIKELDTAGAWLIVSLMNTLNKKRIDTIPQNFTEQHQKLLTLVTQEIKEEKPLPKTKDQSWIAQLGRYSVDLYDEFCSYIAFIGYLTFEAIRVILNPKHLRFREFASIIDLTGIRALPIIGLLSFLIGVVLAYQMGLQLRNYGANVFVVDLLGGSVLREFGALITAIIVAGRSGAAFTAQLGTMKVNQEIDALNTMGVTPAELLLLPKIAGLVIVMPLLTMWADFFGIFGGMLMANNLLQIGWSEFLARFEQQVPLRSLLIGLGKAPVFALIIASVGCFQGMNVKLSADSVGKLTTRSVVLSIFFIIVVDAAFSIILSKLKL